MKLPTITFDPNCGAIYIKLGKGKVCYTHEGAPPHTVLSFDIGPDNEVVGFEIIGCFDLSEPQSED